MQYHDANKDPPSARLPNSKTKRENLYCKGGIYLGLRHTGTYELLLQVILKVRVCQGDMFEATGPPP